MQILIFNETEGVTFVYASGHCPLHAARTTPDNTALCIKPPEPSRAFHVDLRLESCKHRHICIQRLKSKLLGTTHKSVVVYIACELAATIILLRSLPPSLSRIHLQSPTNSFRLGVHSTRGRFSALRCKRPDRHRLPRYAFAFLINCGKES